MVTLFAPRSGHEHSLTNQIQGVQLVRITNPDFLNFPELRELISLVPAPIAVFDAKMRYVAANERWATNFGVELADIIGVCHYDVFPEVPERWKEVHQRCLRGERLRSDRDESFVRLDGHTQWSRWEMDPIENDEGVVVGAILLVEVLTRLKESEQQLARALSQTVRAISNALERRDPHTAGHQRNVSKLAVAIAEARGWDKNRIEGVRLGAEIHDIGKIYVPAELLSKPGRLSKEEFSLIKKHPEVGHDIVADVEFPWPIKDMIAQHHERLNGTGYPYGLSGDEIIPEAKVIAVADVVEAITSHRPYRPALGTEVALAEIEKGRGTMYCVECVDACLKLFREDGFHWAR